MQWLRSELGVTTCLYQRDSALFALNPRCKAKPMGLVAKHRALAVTATCGLWASLFRRRARTVSDWLGRIVVGLGVRGGTCRLLTPSV